MRWRCANGMICDSRMLAILRENVLKAVYDHNLSSGWRQQIMMMVHVCKKNTVVVKVEMDLCTNRDNKLRKKNG